MFCPNCGVENQANDFCRDCHTNLAIIEKFLAREDAAHGRTHIISRTGLVSIIVSEGFAWTMAGLAAFLLIIFLATIVLSRRPDAGTTFLAAILLALIVFCGVPLLLGLVLILKDVIFERAKSEDSRNN